MYQFRFIFMEIKQPGKKRILVHKSHQAARQINVFGKQLNGFLLQNRTVIFLAKFLSVK